MSGSSSQTPSSGTTPTSSDGEQPKGIARKIPRSTGERSSSLTSNNTTSDTSGPIDDIIDYRAQASANQAKCEADLEKRAEADRKDREAMEKLDEFDSQKLSRKRKAINIEDVSIKEPKKRIIKRRKVKAVPVRKDSDASDTPPSSKKRRIAHEAVEEIVSAADSGNDGDIDAEPVNTVTKTTTPSKKRKLEIGDNEESEEESVPPIKKAKTIYRDTTRSVTSHAYHTSEP
ncbi:hypothetical protein LTR66_017903, partial [Elasticomyces elasticus]